MVALLRVLLLSLWVAVTVLGAATQGALPAFAQSSDPTEPPVPRAAPLGIVSEETLPRAGGVLVFGAADGPGLEAVKELVHRGEKVTVLVAASADTAALKALGVTLVTGDVLAAADVTRAFTTAPFRVVVTALGGRERDVHAIVEGTHNVAAAAKTARIPRMILLSTVGAGDSFFVQPWYLRPFETSFDAAEASAENELRRSDVAFTIVRAGWLVDRGPSGKAVLSGDLRLFSWLARADAGRLLADCVKNENSANKVLTGFDPSRATLWSLVF